MRKHERAIIKARCIKRDGNAKNFSAEWKKYHDAKVKTRIEQQSKDGKVTAVRTKPTTKKKQHHYNDVKMMIQHMRAMKQIKKQADKRISLKKQNNASE